MGRILGITEGPTMWAYLRSSRKPVTFRTQQEEIRDYLRRNDLPPMPWDQFKGEQISGYLDWKRRELKEVMEVLRPGDTLLTSEISRLGRELFATMEFCRLLKEKGVNLICTLQPAIRLSDNPLDKHILALYILGAEMEYDNMQKRYAIGRRRYIAEGKHWGRVEGTWNKTHKYDPYAPQIRQALERGFPFTRMAYSMHWDPKSLKNFITRQMGIKLERSVYDWHVYVPDYVNERYRKSMIPYEPDPWLDPEGYIKKYGRLPYCTQLAKLYQMEQDFILPKDREQRRLIYEAFKRREIPDFVRPMIEEQNRNV